jgi:hypothetical protein
MKTMERNPNMGMFDKEEQLKNQPWAENEQPFTIHSGQFNGQVTTSYGDNVKATVIAGPDKGEFILYGTMAEQIGRMEDGELPASVKIGQDGQSNVLRRA